MEKIKTVKQKIKKKIGKNWVLELVVEGSWLTKLNAQRSSLSSPNGAFSCNVSITHHTSRSLLLPPLDLLPDVLAINPTSSSHENGS
uniref:Uncharacterized protein n=1 Tax=Oryza brachyantha TaxID=4533 RepID=J3LAK1_ORYBR